MSRWLLARSDAFVVHSEFDRRQVAATFAVSGRPLHVLPHGPFDHHVGETPVAATPAADGLTTVLFFGTIRPYKGLEHLVTAFNALTEDEARGLRLLIVGETWEGWDLPLELARRSPHADRIEIVNRYVHDDEISGFFARADAVALPYTRSSASGPLHIAMAFGRPIVLTDVGGLRDGAAGYAGITWVPPNDEAALTEALRALPAVRGMRYPDVRSWDDTVQTYEKLIGELGIDPAASPRPSAVVPEPAS
jgi:glycosyltransferase involved in cell wall biosynthesis